MSSPSLPLTPTSAPAALDIHSASIDYSGHFIQTDLEQYVVFCGWPLLLMTFPRLICAVVHTGPSFLYG